MTSRDFAYWLQGFFELTGPGASLTTTQVEVVKAHLAMVFAHEIDPRMGSKEHREELQEIHDRKAPCGSAVVTRGDLKTCTLPEGHEGPHRHDERQERVQEFVEAVGRARGLTELRLMC